MEVHLCVWLNVLLTVMTSFSIKGVPELKIAVVSVFLTNVGMSNIRLLLAPHSVRGFTVLLKGSSARSLPQSR